MVALSAIVLGALAACTGEAATEPEAIAPDALAPCATATFEDDGARRPAAQTAGAFTLQWEDGPPLQRGTANFAFSTPSDVERVGLRFSLLARDHDAFVPAERVFDVNDGWIDAPVDLYLEGPWELVARGFAPDDEVTEEVRFAFCVAP